MQLRVLLVLLSVAFASTALGADSLFFGRALENSYEGHRIHRCPEGAICNDSLYRWKLIAERTVAGPGISGRVDAVAEQDTAATPQYVGTLKVFLLRPASDLPFLPHFTSAKYYLVSLSPLYKDGSYCLSVDPRESAPKLRGVHANSDGTFCFPADQFR
jgi:hypothetical protein